MDVGLIWFWGWTAVLAVLLFFPVSKLIWVTSVRRMQRKLQRDLTEEETAGQLKRARFIALLLVVIFAALFNYNVFGIPGRT